MRTVRLRQVGNWVAMAAGAGVGCGQETPAPSPSSTSTSTSELMPGSKPESTVKQRNLVADQAGFARKTDPDLQNAWGIAFRGRSIWITANHTGTDRQYSEDGKLGEVITLVDADGMTLASPTGQVINPFSDAFKGDTFVVASEDGDIFAANPGTPAGAIRIPNEGAAVYKGVAISTFHGAPRLFATDFHNRKVDTFDGDYAPVTPGGAFVDPELATLTEDGTTPGEMYAPFNIRRFGDNLLVTFALQKGPDNDDDDGGPGRGFVDLFDTDGNYLQRLITRGQLNSPWGLDVSVEEKGDLDLMVGNFGDGHINVYGLSFHPRHVRADFEGALANRKHEPIAIEGLWGIAFGSGADDFERSDLYFAAGPGNGEEVETHGLYGEIDFGRRR